MVFSNVCSGIGEGPLKTVTPVMPAREFISTFHSVVAFIVGVDKVTRLDLSPEHIVSFSLEKVRVGVGLTVIVNDFGIPVQPLAIGVTVTVEGMEAFVVLVVVNDGILPDPLACKPIDGFELVQV